jgi:transposase
MRYELTDDEWTAIRPMLPSRPRGVPRVNDRRVLNGIFWLLRSGRHGETCRILTVARVPATSAKPKYVTAALVVGWSFLRALPRAAGR